MIVLAHELFRLVPMLPHLVRELLVPQPTDLPEKFRTGGANAIERLRWVAQVVPMQPLGHHRIPAALPLGHINAGAAEQFGDAFVGLVSHRLVFGPHGGVGDDKRQLPRKGIAHKPTTVSESHIIAKNNPSELGRWHVAVIKFPQRNDLPIAANAMHMECSRIPPPMIIAAKEAIAGRSKRLTHNPP